MVNRIQGTHFEIIHEDENQVEVSFTRNWDPTLQGKLVPLNIDKRFVEIPKITSLLISCWVSDTLLYVGL